MDCWFERIPDECNIQSHLDHRGPHVANCPCDSPRTERSTCDELARRRHYATAKNSLLYTHQRSVFDRTLPKDPCSTTQDHLANAPVPSLQTSCTVKASRNPAFPETTRS